MNPGEKLADQFATLLVSYVSEGLESTGREEFNGACLAPFAPIGAVGGPWEELEVESKELSKGKVGSGCESMVVGGEALFGCSWVTYH